MIRNDGGRYVILDIDADRAIHGVAIHIRRRVVESLYTAFDMGAVIRIRCRVVRTGQRIAVAAVRVQGQRAIAAGTIGSGGESIADCATDTERTTRRFSYNFV